MKKKKKNDDADADDDGGVGAGAGEMSDEVPATKTLEWLATIAQLEPALL